MVAEKAKAFGLKVVAYDPYVDQKIADQFGVTLLPFDELLKISDFVSVHIPLTKDTENMVDKKAFSLMKSNAILINTSRGPLVNEDALYEAISNKKIAGAGLDVTVHEPLEENSKLRGLPNVIITPHVAWYSEEAELDLKVKNAQNVAEVAAGFDNAAIVNKDVRKKLNLKTK